MPQQAWSQKRERQYEHIKESQENRGVPEPTAKRGCGPNGQQGKGASGRVTPGQPYVGRRHFLGAPGRVAVAPGGRRPQPRSALRRGETARHQRPLEDVETTTRRSGRKIRGHREIDGFTVFTGCNFDGLVWRLPAAGTGSTVLVDLLIAIVIVVIAAVLGLVVHPLLWIIIIFAVLWLFFSAVSLVMGETALRRHAPNQKRGTK